MQTQLEITDLPVAPLDAAADFHARYLPQARDLLGDVESLVLILPPAERAHQGWRLAVVQELARAAAPDRRVNAIIGDDQAAIQQTLTWLSGAPGITGQLLGVDGNLSDSPA
ncbi:hypothetical protein GRI97_11725 [Altererythrobacter xixiisoli]|uniref:Short chain dehydrogenase-like proteobacteria domain-containing protein n=1 Tax=Croceibacterium xixiisoli TaxID=1476466 RepID=A0A6I4TYD7_9SPHN|nr:hypothetical protein [Croceibacterium xixiisoli]MXO99658.1 hypothetical protein [Croceibacterium xixiisoli]